MNITKFGHCCLLIEIGDCRILTDPGNYCATPHVTDIDVILITHEHADHVHIESLQAILTKNPGVQVITHVGVSKVLDEAGIAYVIISDKEERIIKDVAIVGLATEHAVIHRDLPTIPNMGFMIGGGKLFYPGDAFYDPKQPVDVLALPVAGPWMRLEEAVEYAKLLKPKVVFPVHDGMLRQGVSLGPTRRIPTLLLAPLDIKYVDMTEGLTQNFSDFLR